MNVNQSIEGAAHPPEGESQAGGKKRRRRGKARVSKKMGKARFLAKRKSRRN